MDLSGVTTVALESDDVFMKADRHDGSILEHRHHTGCTFTLAVSDGKASYGARDELGQKLDVFFLTLSPNDRCAVCITRSRTGETYCFDVPCDDIFP